MTAVPTSTTVLFNVSIPTLMDQPLSDKVITLKVPAGWFMSLPKFRCQRDTESHAKKAGKKHLAKPFVTHYAVNAVLNLNTSEIHKLDGHTRSYLWETGALAKPEVLSVTIWIAKDYEEAKQIYNAFDNRHATEQVSEQRVGSLSEINIYLRSSIMKRSFSSAAKAIIDNDSRLLEGCSVRNKANLLPNDEQIVNANFANIWGAHVKALDDLDLANTKRKHPTPNAKGGDRMYPIMRYGYVAAAIVLTSQYGIKYVESFLDLYHRGAGNQMAGVKDYILVLMEWTERKVQIGNEGRQSSGIDAAVKDFVDFWYCFEMWRRNHTIRQLPRWDKDVYANVNVSDIIRTCTGQDAEATEFLDGRRRTRPSTPTPEASAA